MWWASMPNFAVAVSYSQIAVFDGGLRKPFNDWSDQHVRQGFSWRDGSASFRTLIDSGPMTVEVVTRDRVTLKQESTRAISVPFEVRENTSVEVATIAESYPIELDRGAYQVVFETGANAEGCWCRLTFVRDGEREPRILLQDPRLDPVFPLLMEAHPA